MFPNHAFGRNLNSPVSNTPIIIISNIFTYLGVPLSERETTEPFTQSWWWKLGKDLMGVVFKRLLSGKFVQ